MNNYREIIVDKDSITHSISIIKYVHCILPVVSFLVIRLPSGPMYVLVCVDVDIPLLPPPKDDDDDDDDEKDVKELLIPPPPPAEPNMSCPPPPKNSS